ALIAAAALTGCFGGGSSDSPEDVLSDTFNNETPVTSADLDVSLTVDAKGSRGGHLTASLKGPFQGDENDPTAFPQFDLTAAAQGDVVGQSVDFSAGATATTDQAFVTFQGQTYEVPSSVYDAFKSSYQQQAQAATSAQDSSGTSTSALFDQLGIDPS